MARCEVHAILSVYDVQGTIIDCGFTAQQPPPPGLERSKLTRLPDGSRSLDHSRDRCDLGCGHDMIYYCDHHAKQYASINTNDMNRHKRSDENKILSKKQFFSDLPQPFVEEIPPNEDQSCCKYNVKGYFAWG